MTAVIDLNTVETGIIVGQQRSSLSIPNNSFLDNQTSGSTNVSRSDRTDRTTNVDVVGADDHAECTQNKKPNNKPFFFPNIKMKAGDDEEGKGDGGVGDDGSDDDILSLKLAWVDEDGEERILWLEMDVVFRVAFPLLFLVFNAIFWPMFLTRSF